MSKKELLTLPLITEVDKLLTKKLSEVDFSNPSTYSFIHFGPGNPG